MLEAATSDRRSRRSSGGSRRATCCSTCTRTRSTRAARSPRSWPSTRRTSPSSRPRSSRSSSATASASAWATPATTTTCCCSGSGCSTRCPRRPRSCAGPYDHILVDEYQDTNRLQGDIVDGMARVKKNVTVVGDDAQAIYSFRGASFENILGFPRALPGGADLRLTRNYRSTPEILALANASIAHNARQFPKELRAAREAGADARGRRAAGHPRPGALRGPAPARVARRGRKLQDLAVLYRAHYQALELQIELTRRGIPYEIRSGTRFFEQRHVKDVLAFLRIIVNPKDELSWKRALKLFPRVGERSASAVWEAIGAAPDPLAAFRALDAEVGDLGRGSEAALEALPLAARARLDGPSLRSTPPRRSARSSRTSTRTMPGRSSPTATPAWTTSSSSPSSPRPTTRCPRSWRRSRSSTSSRARTSSRRRARRRPGRPVVDPPGQGPRVEPGHRHGALGGAVPNYRSVAHRRGAGGGAAALLRRGHPGEERARARLPDARPRPVRRGRHPGALALPDASCPTTVFERWTIEREPSRKRSPRWRTSRSTRCTSFRA